MIMSVARNDTMKYCIFISCMQWGKHAMIQHLHDLLSTKQRYKDHISEQNQKPDEQGEKYLNVLRRYMQSFVGLKQSIMISMFIFCLLLVEILIKINAHCGIKFVLKSQFNSFFFFFFFLFFFFFFFFFFPSVLGVSGF